MIYFAKLPSLGGMQKKYTRIEKERKKVIYDFVEKETSMLY